MQPHFPALGDFLRFVEIFPRLGEMRLHAIQRRPGEKTPRQIMLRPSFPQARHCLVEMVFGLGKEIVLLGNVCYIPLSPPSKGGRGGCLAQAKSALDLIPFSVILCT